MTGAVERGASQDDDRCGHHGRAEPRRRRRGDAAHRRADNRRNVSSTLLTLMVISGYLRGGQRLCLAGPANSSGFSGAVGAGAEFLRDKEYAVTLYLAYSRGRSPEVLRQAK